jgi:hypothetical protein
MQTLLDSDNEAIDNKVFDELGGQFSNEWKKFEIKEVEDEEELKDVRLKVQARVEQKF